MPWKRMPWILSPTAIIVKTSPFENDGLTKRIVYDCTASGVNLHLAQHAEMNLPTILRLLQSMGKDYFMAKSDLKDMFYKFPARQADWTFLGFSHPVTGQYFVVPFYAMGGSDVPPLTVKNLLRQCETSSRTKRSADAWAPRLYRVLNRCHAPLLLRAGWPRRSHLRHLLQRSTSTSFSI